MLLLPAGAYAQSAVQGLPGVVNRPTPQVPLPPTPTPIPLPGGTPSPEGITNPTGPVPTLKQIDFEGVKSVPLGDLQAIASHYLNRNLTRGDIANLKYQIAKRYYESGYILVRVVTPPQDLSSGTLHIVVYEAKIETVTVPNNRLVSPYITGGIASEIHKGEVFQEDNVESMVRDMDDLHGVKASVDLSPGSQVGTTDLTVKLEKDHDFQQQVSVNNYGSKLTGQYLFNGNFQYANLLGLGELYTLDVSHSDGSFFSIRPGVEIPTGLWNIVFDAELPVQQVGREWPADAAQQHGPDGRRESWLFERAAEHGGAEDRRSGAASRAGTRSRISPVRASCNRTTSCGSSTRRGATCSGWRTRRRLPRWRRCRGSTSWGRAARGMRT